MTAIDGTFSWDDAVSGHCPHPATQSLFTPPPEREVLNLIQGDDEFYAEPEPAPPEEEDFADHTILRRASDI